MIQISPANLERSQFLGAGRNFRTSIGSFRFTSSWDSEVILSSRRLALKYNTIRRATLQAFFASFLLFFRFCIHPLVFCLKSVPALTPTQHICGVRLLPVGGGVALYTIRRASAAFTGQTDALLYIIAHPPPIRKAFGGGCGEDAAGKTPPVIAARCQPPQGWGPWHNSTVSGVSVKFPVTPEAPSPRELAKPSGFD